MNRVMFISIFTIFVLVVGVGSYFAINDTTKEDELTMSQLRQAVVDRHNSKEYKTFTIVLSGNDNTTISFVTTTPLVAQLKEQVFDSDFLVALKKAGFKKVRICVPDSPPIISLNLETGQKQESL